jgi:hypothetical protein
MTSRLMSGKRPRRALSSLIVFDGNRGSGFAVQAEAGLILPLPALLRTIADDIEKSGATA